ncbi:c-type cytochrome [Aquihabitans sp. McL0605]|uniref:c-type cytochrome n=1 Tax=Aquihabitans sp. McL0605 TaxID=3415671 RepID=UPI003CE76F0A
MTEIPEHLLKRAAAARAAKSGGDGDAPADAPAAASGDAPAAAAAAPAAAVEKTKAAPAPLPTLDEAAPAAKPDIAVVAAAKRRKRIPYWAAPVLALLPLWGVLYVSSVQPPPAGESDPFVIGKAVYTANCASCHQADGSGVKSGGTGQVLTNGEVEKTFADPLSQVYWEHFGAADGGARADGTYGDSTREGGARNVNDLPSAQMPGFASLTSEEMAAVVIYIREEIDGGKPADDPNFNSELFAQDPAAMAALVDAVTALKAGDPDAVSTVTGAEGGK